MGLYVANHDFFSSDDSVNGAGMFTIPSDNLYFGCADKTFCNVCVEMCLSISMVAVPFDKSILKFFTPSTRDKRF